MYHLTDTVLCSEQKKHRGCPATWKLGSYKTYSLGVRTNAQYPIRPLFEVRRRMGKQSRRRGNVVGKHEAYKAVFVDGKEVVMPPECPGWKNDEEALAALAEYGWVDAKYAANFSSEDLVKEIGSQLVNKKITVVDGTSMIPKGPDGSHSIFGRVCYDLDRESKSTKDKAIIMLRTPSNTPAFVGGATYAFIASEGSVEKAKAAIKGSSCPSLMVFYDGQHMQLPSVCIQGTHKLAAKIVAGMLDQNEQSFCCAVCLESLLDVKTNGQVGIVPFVATECDHGFHPRCVMEHFRAGGTTCPSCRGPLPVSWVPCGKKAKPRSDNPFLQPKKLGELHSNVPEDRAGYLNALADQVRRAAIEDGLEGVPEEPPSLS